MPNIALLFPGQGAQVVGMAQGLLERSDAARGLFSEASEILGYDLAELCKVGPAESLNQTDNSQPALFVHSMAALADHLEQNPDFANSVTAVAGLSLGEYSALCAAGGLSFRDGVRLVQQRGAAMQSASTAVASGMASVIGLETEQVESLCKANVVDGEILQVANLLCPGNIAISGQAASIDAAEAASAAAGAMKFIRLPVAGAFHTDIMLPAKAQLTRALTEVSIGKTRYPLFSNVDAQPHVHVEDFRRLFPEQLVSPVLWEASIRNMIEAGVEEFYEIGAGRVLAGTVKRINRKIPCTNIGS